MSKQNQILDERDRLLDDVKAGRLTGDHLQALCALGAIKAPRDRVLLFAIHDVDAVQSPIMEHAEVKALRDAREAVAFRVIHIGSRVPADCGFVVGDLVVHNSASGDPLDHTDTSCPFWLVHHEDIIGVIDVDALEANVRAWSASKAKAA